MSDNKKEAAPEVPVHKQPNVEQMQKLSNITLDFGLIEPSKLYVTTDKAFYDGMKENPRFIPIVTPNDFKESLHILMDFQLYIFRVSQE
jgi:hypothetical protein